MTTRAQIGRALGELGLRRGDLVMAHAGLRAVGPIVGGVNSLLQAIFDIIGPEGTLAAYLDFEAFYEDEDESDDVPVFDKRIAQAARDHGILHETIRNWPGAVRSDHPDAGVAAIGPLAEWLTADHPFQYGYGEGSPFEKFYQRNGRVLMIGAPLDTITMLHYAEHKARLPGRRIHRYRRRMPGPAGPQWVEFEEFDTGDPVCDFLPQDCFQQIGEAFVAAGCGRVGKVGEAATYLLDTRELIPFAIAWLEEAAK